MSEADWVGRGVWPAMGEADWLGRVEWCRRREALRGRRATRASPFELTFTFRSANAKAEPPAHWG